MAVTSIQLMMPREATAQTQRKGMLAEIVNRQYIKRLLVTTNDYLDGPETILGTSGIPTLGESYILGNDADVLATCVKVQVNPLDVPLLWEVVATYDTSRVVDAFFDNPLNQPPEVSWSFAGHTRPMVRDIRGVPVLSSAGNAFDPPYEYEDSRPVVSIVRNEAYFNSALAIAYQDACNADVFGPAGIYQARMVSISGQRQADVGISYYRVTYEIQFRRESFAVPILDQDFRGIDGRQFRDPLTAAPLSNPTLLNGRGRARTVATGTLAEAMDAQTNLAQVDIDPDDWPPLADGILSDSFKPPHYYFEFRVDQEICQVYSVIGNKWLVTRAWAGTTAANHGAGARITLEPYYLRYLPYKAIDFAPLNLPVL